MCAQAGACAAQVAVSGVHQMAQHALEYHLVLAMLRLAACCTIMQDCLQQARAGSCRPGASGVMLHISSGGCCKAVTGWEMSDQLLTMHPLAGLRGRQP